MPRKARNTQNTSIFHIIQKSPFIIFRNNDDRLFFLKELEIAKKKYQFNCYGFSICQNNQFELIIHVMHQSLSKIMQSVLIAYSKYYGQAVTLFPNRFVSYPLQNDTDIDNKLRSFSSGVDQANASLCLYLGKEHSYRLIDFFTKTSIDSNMKKQVKPLDSALKDFLTKHDCLKHDLKQDLNLRNHCLIKLYQETNCTLKSLSIMFDLSVSTISKILKNQANQL